MQDAYVSISLDESPDDIAEVLFRGMLPRDGLFEVDLSAGDQEAMTRFGAALIARVLQRSLERDEIIRFVEENRQVLERTGWLTELSMMFEALNAVDVDDAPRGQLPQALLDVLRQFQHALSGNPERIEVISNRLLYLCVALDMKIRAGHLGHTEAVKYWLDRPQVRQLMSPPALQFLLGDYIRHMDELNEDRAGYVCLVAECALLVDEPVSQRLGATLLRGLRPPLDAVNWLDVRRRLGRRLQQHGQWDQSDEQALRKAVQRFAERVPDHDL